MRAAAALGCLAAPKRLRANRLVNGSVRIGFIGVGSRGSDLLRLACNLQSQQGNVEVAAVCDVFKSRREMAVAGVKSLTGKEPSQHLDYREILADDAIDAVCIGTPDHWHARQTLDALAADKDVYCEKPMTRTIDESLQVLAAARASSRVLQIGVQSTALPVWSKVNEWIRGGRLGKVMQYQTEFYRNSAIGQWRNYSMTPDMTPTNIDWERFLGLEFELAPPLPFDRRTYAQWRCLWDFGSGMFTDLFVHRTTAMLLATGLRFPARVVGAGGIYLELDGRQVPDVGTVIADFPEGVQGIVAATMCSANTPSRQLIRGHHGSVVFGNGEDFTGFDFVAERPQVTGDSEIVDQRVEVGGVDDPSREHFQNFLDAVHAGDPGLVNCDAELGAAAIVNVRLGARSYREGKVFRFDAAAGRVSEADGSWSRGWEQRSANRGAVRHVPGWNAGSRGSTLTPTADAPLGGPWIDGVDPAAAPGAAAK